MNTRINQILRTMVKLGAAGLLAGLIFVARPSLAQIQVGIEFAPPPPEFVATAEPVYFEGHPAYWYNGHWHYRDEHGGWRYYHDEPAFLAERRGRMAPGRRYYERHDEHDRRWHR